MAYSAHMSERVTSADLQESSHGGDMSPNVDEYNLASNFVLAGFQAATIHGNIHA